MTDLRELVAELRQTRSQQVAHQEVINRDGGRAGRTSVVDVPIHGQIALRAADAIERLLDERDLDRKLGHTIPVRSSNMSDGVKGIGDE